MIWKCMWCYKEIEHLRTPGDEVCDDLLCPECEEKDFRVLVKEWEETSRATYDPQDDPLTGDMRRAVKLLTERYNALRAR